MREQILTAIRAGHTTAQTIATYSRLSVDGVRIVLVDMTSRGILARNGDNFTEA